MAELPVIEFRTGVADPLGYAARWLKVAVARGTRVRVLGAPERLQALDQLLWTADKEGFLPHVRAGQAAAARPGHGITPVWLGEGSVAGPEPELVLSLGGDTLPARIGTYRRIVEVVGSDAADAQDGRQRWQAYRRAGFEPAHRAAEA